MLKSPPQVLFCQNWIGTSNSGFHLPGPLVITFSYTLQLLLPFPGDSVVMNSFARQDTRRWRFSPWVGKIRGMKKWQPIPVILPGKSRAGEPGRSQSMRSQKTWIWVSETVYVFCTFFFFWFITFLDPTEEKRKLFGTLKDPNTRAQSRIIKHI